MRRATNVRIAHNPGPCYFYPRSPCGERRAVVHTPHWYGKFLSTLSLRRATSDAFAAVSTLLISIHALLAESDFIFSLPPVLILLFLSTLSLRRATLTGRALLVQRAISIHALLAESDLAAVCYDYYSIGFLSTLSLRRATWLPFVMTITALDFYPRSPCGERLSKKAAIGKPTLISIHALLAESDPTRLRPTGATWHFYPRSPCGERRWELGKSNGMQAFLSTLSLRRATEQTARKQAIEAISIHALLAESDKYLTGGKIHDPDFYPRSPCGERLLLLVHYFSQSQISIHALLAESDSSILCTNGRYGYFYPRSPCGERP